MLLCFGCSSLQANIWPMQETLELLTEQLPDENTQALYQVQSPYRTALYNSYAAGHNPYARTQFTFKAEYFQALGGLKYRSSQLDGNLQLRYRDQLALGSYRMAWGQGLVLYKAEGRGALLSPANPQSYSPQGVAAETHLKDIHILALASQQKRSAKLQEGQISLLPKTKTDYLGTVQETLYAAAISYDLSYFSLGALYYHQHYDRSFEDSRRDSLLSTISISTAWHNAAHKVLVECALQDQPAVAASWQMQVPAFLQEWKYQSRGRYQRPAYARAVNTISQAQNRQELSAQMLYSPIKHLHLGVQSTINQGFGALDEARWWGEHKGKVSYGDALSNASIALTSIDRAILSAVDESYSTSIPRHYRLGISLRHELVPGVATALAFRYHHQEKKLALRAGSWWAQSVSYSKAKTQLSLGYSVWNSSNFTLLIPDDSEAGYQSRGQHSAAIEFAAEQNWQDFTVKLKLQQELARSHCATANLSLNYRSQGRKAKL